MKIFITGGSGFVGSHLVPALIKAKHEVYALARSEKSAEILKKLGASIVEGDCLDIKNSNIDLKGIDVVIHLAAKLGLWGSYDDFYQLNVKGTENLIKESIRHGVKKFIYMSTAVVVVEGKTLNNIDESYKPTNDPKNSYSLTKIMAERIVLKYKNQIQTIALRPPLIWGEGMGFMQNFKDNPKNSQFAIIGDKEHNLATCHVLNVVSAILYSIKSKNEGVFFITDGEKIPLRVFIDKLFKASGLDVKIKYMTRNFSIIKAYIYEFIWKIFRIKSLPPLTKAMVFIMGTEISIDDSKARKELGYKNVVSIKQGLVLLSKSL